MFSRTTEYALRAISVLAERHPESMATSEIADVAQVPSAYLVKVLQALRKAGIVRSQRGVGGGVGLQVPLQELTMLDVVNAVDPIERIDVCPLGLAAHGSRLCGMHARLDRALAMIEEVFRDAKVGEILAEGTGRKPGCRFPRVKRKK